MNPTLKRDLKRLKADRERVAQEFHTVLSRGEEVLDHAHQVAHDIEEKVRQILEEDDRASPVSRKDKDTFAKASPANPSLVDTVR